MDFVEWECCFFSSSKILETRVFRQRRARFGRLWMRAFCDVCHGDFGIWLVFASNTVTTASCCFRYVMATFLPGCPLFSPTEREEMGPWVFCLSVSAIIFFIVFLTVKSKGRGGGLGGG